MKHEKSVSTRDFLRNFKKFREMLGSGRITQISVGSGDDILEVKLRSHPALTGKELVRRARALKTPIKVERPDIFSDMIERIEKRKKGSKRNHSNKKND